MGVLSTVAFWGLLVLAIPVIIHLVNPGKGKLVWVGDIKLLKGVKSNRVNEFKIKRWLLLLLRLLIFTLLVLLMARPFMLTELRLFGGSTVLVTQDWLEAADAKQIQSLDEYQVLSSNKLWQQLAMWHQKVEANKTFEVYTLDCIDAVESALKPQFNRQINWHLTPCPQKDLVNTAKTLTLIAKSPDKRLLAALNAIKLSAMPTLKLQVQATQAESTGFSHWYIYQNEEALAPALLNHIAKGSVALIIADKQDVVRGDEPKPWGRGLIVPFSLENAQSGRFPAELLSSLTRHLPFSQRIGELAMSEAQLSITPSLNSNFERKVALNPYLVYLLIVVWLIERFVAERVVTKPRDKAND